MKMISTVPRAAGFLWLLLLLTLSAVRHGNAQVVISEFQALNESTVKDPDYQLYSDWLEIYNGDPSDVVFSGYTLTDNLLLPGKWELPAGLVLPAGGYLLIWADGRDSGLHASFKLNGSGEELGLFGPEGELIDSVVYFQQRTDHSTGRISSSGAWAVFTGPTPGAPNPDSGFEGIAGEPRFSDPGGFHDSPVSLELATPSPGGVVRYTVDGSEPDSSSAIWQYPLDISTTAVVRARVYQSNTLPGNTVSQTYFINEPDHDLPVVSISTAPDHLWDPQTGIYVNYMEEWERPCGFELFSPAGEPEIGFNAGLRIFGGTSRHRAQKSLSIHARSRYGTDVIRYPLLPGRKADEYGSFILRNGANDWSGDWRGTLFRDALIHTIVENRMDLDYQSYNPVVVYLNGEYWGILNIRDKHNEDYCEFLYGADPDSVDIIKHNQVMSGNDNLYNEMMEFLESHDLYSNETYEEAAGMIDTEELINYLITEIYSCNIDWPANNQRLWRPQTDGGKWRWMLFDTEFGFNGFQWAPVTTNMFNKALDPDINDYVNTDLKAPWATRVFIKMTQNEGFRNRFISTYLSHIYTTYDPDRVYAIVDSLRGRLEAEMPRHIARWGSEGGIYDMNVWQQNVDGMKDFASDRPPYAVAHLMETFQIREEERVKLDLSCAEGGTLILNGIPLNEKHFTGDFFLGNPVKLDVEPVPGYLFKSWTIIDSALQKSVFIQKGDEWKYLDDGSDQGEAWTAKEFPDQSWKTGSAKFGYGEGDEQTVVSYGGNPDNKYITTYFRKEFQVENTDLIGQLKIRLLRDDGALIYLNGIVVTRSNMTSREVDYQTLALNPVTDADENVYYEYDIDPELLADGSNVLAAEVHQASATSTDLGFDLELVGYGKDPAPQLQVDTRAFEIVMDGDMQIAAHMVREDTAITLKINEIVTSNSSGIRDEFGEAEDWIEIYNPGEEAVDLGGLFLTDSLGIPELWEVPRGYPGVTTVAGQGFIVLWADDQPSQGPLHLGFKLSREGEQVGLFRRSGDSLVLIDSVSYSSMDANVSLARVPDATGPWVVFEDPTPGAFNFYSGETAEEISAGVLRIFPNPTHGPVRIEWPEDFVRTGDNEIRVTLYSGTGQMILDRRYHTGETINLDLSSGEPGLYLVRVVSGKSSRTGQIIHLLK